MEKAKVKLIFSCFLSDWIEYIQGGTVGWTKPDSLSRHLRLWDYLCMHTWTHREICVQYLIEKPRVLICRSALLVSVFPPDAAGIFPPLSAAGALARSNPDVGW